jgi:hypothetical protein
MAGMTKRERVQRAFRFQETDRIPIFDIFQNDPVIEHYSRQELNYDNGDWVKGIAIGRVLDMTSRPDGPRFAGIERRPDGMVIQQERWSRWVAHRPFEDTEGMIEWLRKEISNTKKQQYGESYRQKVHEDVRRYLSYFAEGDDSGMKDPTVLAAESSVGLKDLTWLLGTQHFLSLLHNSPDLIDEWLEARSQAELRRIAAIADANLLPVALVADDIITKSGIVFSPEWLQARWIPKLKQVVDTWHNHKTAVLFRSEGNIMPFVADVVGAGVDGLNPLEGMPVQTLRDRYPKLVLAGGIDTSQLLAFATPDEVRKVCRDTIIAAARKGYFLGSNDVVNWEAQLENVIAMYESSGSRVDRPAPAKRRF